MYSFAILFLVSFFGTLYVLPHTIRKLTESNQVAKDMYKVNTPNVPTNAGMVLLFTSFISLSILPFFNRIMGLFLDSSQGIMDLDEKNLAFLLVVSVYALYGLIDDLVDIGRKLKVVLPIAFGFPLISFVNANTIWIPIFGNFDLMDTFYSDILWNDLFRIIVIPVYIMVVSNLVNMHSGYNGLQSGLSIIIILTLLIKSNIDGKIEGVLPASSFIGSFLAFWLFNKYPSKVFEGNVGSLLFGSIIGSIIVLQEYWWFGFFILLPHTFNFILWLIWLYLMRKDPDKYLQADGNHKKFATLRSDGTIKVPNKLTLKWIPNYYFRLNEKQSVIICYFVSFFFCLSGVIIFY